VADTPKTKRQTDRQTDRPTDHATRSVTAGRIYVRNTAMRPNSNNLLMYRPLQGSILYIYFSIFIHNLIIIIIRFDRKQNRSCYANRSNHRKVDKLCNNNDQLSLTNTLRYALHHGERARGKFSVINFAKVANFQPPRLHLT